MSDHPRREPSGTIRTMQLAIRPELEERGMLQKDLARMLLISERTISEVLNVRVRTDMNTLDRIAEVLGMEWRVELIPREDPTT